MNMTFLAPPRAGTVGAIPSKSAAHRALICAALAEGETTLLCAGTSEDIDATARVLSALGAAVTREGDYFRVRPLSAARRGAILDCGESGSTLRFLLPVAAALRADADFVRHGRLAVRPLSPLREEMTRHGARFPADCTADPLPLRGQIGAGDYTLASNVSSQFVSGLLLAMPLMEGDSTLTLTGKIESADYIRITTETMRRFGASVTVTEDGRLYRVCGSGYRSPGTFAVEGDWSNGALWLALGAVGRTPITVTGLDIASPQGDRQVLSVLRDFGASVSVAPDGITVSPSPLHGIPFDAAQIPDLVPVLAAVAAAAVGETVITGIARLRLKESDRVAAVCDMLSRLGADVWADETTLHIRGGKRLHGTTVSSFRDHRMVMCAALAASLADGPVTVTEAEAVGKSYPGFADDYRRMGGILESTEAV